MSIVYGIQDIENSKNKIINLYSQIIEKFNGLKDIIGRGDKVLIKPNFVAPFERATTDLVLLECMIRTVLECGGIPIIGDSSGFEFSTEDTLSILKVEDICRKYDVRLVNFDQEQFVSVPTGNPYVPQYLIPKIVREVDRIIDMPCLKGHSITKVTFGIKNLFGILHRNTRRDIHASDLERGLAELAQIFHVDFVLVDGLWNLINAIYSDTYYTGILIAGTDVAAVDRVCCDIFDVDYHDIPHINSCVPREAYSFSQLTPVAKIDSKIMERGEHFEKQNKKYKFLYKMEKVSSALFHTSIVSYCHYYLGIRPVINKKKCIDCGKCCQICPTQAIRNKTIDPHKCMRVRCLKCFDVCEAGAIEKKGTHKS